MSIVEAYPNLLRQLRRIDRRLRQLIRRTPCDISDVHKLFPKARRKGNGPRATLRIGDEPNPYKAGYTLAVDFGMLRPILDLPAEIDTEWLAEWAHDRKRLRDWYEAALTVQAVAVKQGYETELIEVNDKFFRVRKGQRMIVIDYITGLLREGRYIEIHVVSEAHYQWQQDERKMGRYANDGERWLKPIEDWADKLITT